MDLHDVQFSEHDIDMHPLHCDIPWTSYMQTYERFSAKEPPFPVNVAIGTFFLWFCCVYQFVPGIKHGWDVSDSKNTHNALYNSHPNLFLWKKVFFQCEVDTGK